MNEIANHDDRNTAPVVRRLPMNTVGRDFVIGDVHGGFDAVVEGMRAVKFDRARDRLLCTGDLVDRGPGSHRVVEFLQKPYVHSARGNHDDDISSLDLVSLRLLGRANWNGMSWVCGLSDERLEQVQAALKALPVAMEIETPRGLVGIVHADVPATMDWKTFLQRLEAGDEGVRETALTGRDRIKRNDCRGVPGVGRLYVGHTIQWDSPKRLGNVFVVDTGSVFREIDKGKGFLTMANVLHVTAPLVHHQGGVMVIEDQVDHPFGEHLNEAESSHVGEPLRERS